jgi:hypothetical protein
MPSADKPPLIHIRARRARPYDSRMMPCASEA